MSEPEWAKVLEVFYEHNLGFEHDPENIPRNAVEKFNKYDVDIIKNWDQLSYLKNVGLLEYETITVHPTADQTVDVTFLVLSEKGFDVAHKRELTTRQDNTNRMLTVVTVGLFIAALIQALASYYSVAPTYRGVMGIGTAVIIGGFIFFMYEAYRAEFI